MKNLTPAEATRLGVYLIGALIGAFMTVWGIIHSDAALIAAGLTALGLGGVAAPNVGTTTRGKYSAE